MIKKKIIHEDFSSMGWDKFIALCKKTAKSASNNSPESIKRMSDYYTSCQSKEIQEKFQEILGVYGKDGNYIGEANWYFVHKFGFIYAANLILIINRLNQKMLIQKRAHNVSWPNTFDCVGGCFPSTAKNEISRIKHAKKELSEEVFSDDKNIDFNLRKIGITYLEANAGEFIKQQFMHIYVYFINPKDICKIRPNWESTKLEWKSINGIKEMPLKDLAPGLKNVLQAVNLNDIIIKS